MKKKPQAPVSVDSHPAARAADSDLVRLTREFEHLTSELKRLDDAIKEHGDSMEAARINYEMAIDYNRKKVQHAERQKRVLHAQLANVRELLSPISSTSDRLNVATHILDRQLGR